MMPGYPCCCVQLPVVDPCDDPDPCSSFTGYYSFSVTGATNPTGGVCPNCAYYGAAGPGMTDEWKLCPMSTAWTLSVAGSCIGCTPITTYRMEYRVNYVDVSGRRYPTFDVRFISGSPFPVIYSLASFYIGSGVPLSRVSDSCWGPASSGSGVSPYYTYVNSTYSADCICTFGSSTLSWSKN